MAKQFTTMDSNVRDFFAKLKEDSSNKYCIDCGSANPQWASVSFGIFFCLECSGVHRSYGSHISFVRSLTMDAWKERELRIMQLGGNANCISFYRKNGIPDLKEVSMKEKWYSPIAEEYRQRIKALADGKDPNKVPSSSSSSKKPSSSKKDDWDWAEEPAKTNSPTSKSKLSGSSYKSPSADVSNPYSTYQSGGVKTYEGFGSDSSGQFSGSANSSAYKGFGSDSSSGGYNSGSYGGSSPSSYSSSSPSSKHSSSSSKKNGSSRESERKSTKSNRESSISDEKLSKLKGQQSISSAEYFGEDQESDGFRSNNSGSVDLFKSFEDSWNKLSVVAVSAATAVGEKVTAENTSKWASWAQEGVMDYWSKLQAVATGSEPEANNGSPSSSNQQREESFQSDSNTTREHKQRPKKSHKNVENEEEEEEKKLDDWLSDEKPKKSSKGSSKSKSKSVKEENKEDGEWNDWGEETQSPKPKSKSKKSSKVIDEGETENNGQNKSGEWDNWGEETVESDAASKPKKKEPASRKKAEEPNDWDKWDSHW